jgi:hypothetical protein
MTRAEELLEQVKALPPDERDAFDVLFACQQSQDFELSDEWNAEIARRVKSIQDGSARLRSWDEVEAAYADMKERKHRPANP